MEMWTSIKSQQELFGKNEKKLSDDFPVDKELVYFDATDQLETELTLVTPALAPSTKPSSHIGNSKKVEEFTNLNVNFIKRLL
ncbi:hypothetical protein RhiirA4_482295 [Rhizophagus irregularis]|uniref:Uncharacterized protein n=1 Tax=Rhizophagus irregularis TaxID=588596 RepID=A0A2I1HKT3_9GLOM|nr:hypothetical protein RhiirA4_482295 [Rhizophagus irregularis]